jgi:anti-sigma factor RsiW
MELDDDTLQRYYDGELPVKQAQAVQKLVEHSPEAQRRLRELSRLGDLVRMAAVEAASSLDANALFSRIEAGIGEQKRLGFGEHLRVISAEWREHRRGMLVPMLGAAAAAAAALAIVLVPRHAEEPGVGSRPVTPDLGGLVAHGTRVENVDFGNNTGTVFEIDNEGVAAAVVWIADDEEESL